MMIGVEVYTKKVINNEEVLKRLASSKGYDIVADNLNDAFTDFYLLNISTGFVRTNQAHGHGHDCYHVRISKMACKEDFVLFKDIIKEIAALSSGSVYTEDEDHERIDDIEGYFSEDWIQKQMSTDYNMVRTRVYNTVKAHKKFSAFTLCGPVCNFPFYIGINLFKMLGIDEKTDALLAHDLITRQVRYSQYSRPEDMRMTTPWKLVRGENERGWDRYLTIYVKNEYDMISYADLIALKNSDDDTVMLEHNDFMKIAPKKWELFDDKQYFTTDLTDKEWQNLYDEAKRYGTRVIIEIDREGKRGMLLPQTD